MTTLAAAPLAGSRSRRVAYSFGTQLLFIAVTTCSGLVVTPRLVAWLGEERFGAARVIMDYAGYLALLDLGLGGAIAPLMSRALARGDVEALRGTVAAGVRLYVRTAATILVLGLCATPLIPRLVNTGPALAGDVRLAWVISVLGMLAVIVSPFRALADAEQRTYIVNIFYTFQALGVAALGFALASRGFGVTGQTLALASSTGLVAAILAGLAIRRHPGLLLGLAGPPDEEALAAVRRLSGPTLTVTVAGKMSVLSDNIIIGLLMHPAAVTILFVTQRLATLVQSQLIGVGTSSWAALADLHGRGDLDTFNRRLVELTRMIAILGTATLGPIVAFNAQFLARWVGAGKDAGAVVILVAALNAILVSVTSLWISAFTGTGRIRLVMKPIVLMAAINVGASVAGTLLFGVIGPLLGTLVASVAIPAWYIPKLLNVHDGTSIRALASAVAMPVLSGTPYSAALWWAERGRPSPGWLALAAEMSAASAFFLAFSIAFLMRPAERAVWRARLCGLLPRGSGKAGT